MDHNYWNAYLFQLINQLVDLKRMEDDSNQLQERLKKMKAITFYEERQARMLRKVFDSMVAIKKEKENKYKQYYNMILCLKSFKGIMEYAIMQRQLDAQKIKEQKLLEQVQNAIEDQKIQQLINSILKNRKGIYFRRFRQHSTQLVKERKNKEYKQIIENQNSQNDLNQKISRYQQPFSANRLQETAKSGASFLQNSRRSIQTLGENQKKRKFAAIKALPPRPVLNLEIKQAQTIKINQKAIQQDVSEQNSHNYKPIEKNIPFVKEIIQGPNKQMQQPTQVEVKVNKKQQPSQNVLKIKKDDILSLLTQMKIIEILQISQIIEDKDKIFKGQVNLSEKQYIKQSLKVLQKISLII